MPDASMDSMNGFYQAPVFFERTVRWGSEPNWSVNKTVTYDLMLRQSFDYYTYDAVYQLKFSSLVPDSYNVTFDLNAPNDSQEFEFQSAGADTDRSDHSGTGGEVYANGVNADEYRAHLKNDQATPLPNFTSEQVFDIAQIKLAGGSNGGARGFVEDAQQPGTYVAPVSIFADVNENDDLGIEDSEDVCGTELVDVLPMS